MKRFWISVAILGFIFALALVNSFALHTITDQLTGKLDQAQTLAEKEDWMGARAQTQLAWQQWQDQEWYLYIVLRHSDADAVSEQFRAITELLQWGEEAEYTSANAKLMEDIRLLAELEEFTFKNLL